ncbi:MAG TPA: hypothetical protein VGB24_04955 [Longimicrobium sp.]|jgi:hypothetical protein|uniref:hypothetical protein n=1 Tax=Longimicrobium sp. TaxID=2029185 RepID=UPI002EDA8E2B
MQPDGEPRATLYTEAWAGAVLRVAHLPSGHRQAFGSLLALVESAWEHLRPAQLFVERHTPDPAAPWSVLVQFLDSEVIDLFRGLAFSLTEYIPNPPCWDDDSDPTNLDADAGLFGRYVEVLYMATARPDVPEDFRGLVCSCRNGLTRFVEEFTSGIAAIETPAGGCPVARTLIP